MIQEGFYNNVNTKTPFRVIGDLLCKAFIKSAGENPSIRKYIPNPDIKIDPQYILTISSRINPDVSYSFDLKETVKKIYDFVIQKLDNVYVDINHLDNDIWNDLKITSRFGAGFIHADIRASGDKIVLSITGSGNLGIFFDDDTYKKLISTDKENYPTYSYYDFTDDLFKNKFKDKLVLSEPIKTSTVSVCMDLRTYLTKAIDGLHKGSLTPVQVKKNIEDYIKKL